MNHAQMMAFSKVYQKSQDWNDLTMKQQWDEQARIKRKKFFLGNVIA